MEGDDRTFRVDYSSEGVSKLRERVKEKLKEFMGDYTDDTLVEYVIVLLKNGRRKDEAKSELDVFLGDDSDSFISWLWDHLGFNISLYVQPQETSSTARGQAEKTDTRYIQSDAEKRNSNKISGNNLSPELEQLARNAEETEVHVHRKSVMDNDNSKDELDRRVVCTKSPLSPRRAIQKKRRRTDVQQLRKGRREVSQSTITVPKRLLQFALRDAVAPSRPSNSTTEPPPKRLRSVISTSVGDSSLENRTHRIPRTSMSAVIKAMSEAVKDVTKVKSSCNVFELSHATDVSNACSNKGYGIGAEAVFGGDLNMEMKNFQSAYHLQNDIHTLQERNLSFHDTIAGNNPGYDGQYYYDFDGRGTQATAIYGYCASGGIGMDKSLRFQDVGGGYANARVHRPKKYLGQPATVPKTSFRIPSSVSMDTKETPQYHEERKVSDMADHKIMERSDTVAPKSEVRLMKENNNPKVAAFNENGKIGAIARQSQKNQTPTGMRNSGPPTEDVDSRTIFVTNVHFAATKDRLSRHFNKFGEVVKVIILTDPITRQPKGSACIEFMKRDAAELALSLDGTSFMSRIVKIVKKSSAQLEAAAPAMTGPRVAQVLPFSIPRFGRIPFAWSTPTLFMDCTPIKQGARSLQWKREDESTAPYSSGHRSLTYIRTELPKASGSSVPSNTLMFSERKF